MKTIIKTLLASIVAAMSVAQAGTTLTGIYFFSTDTTGNATAQRFHTRAGGSIFKVWLVKGDMEKGEFINGPDSNTSDINIPLSSGTYTYQLFMDGGGATVNPNYGLNLYFNLDNKPAISVSAPVNTTSKDFFPPFAVNNGKTLNMDSTAANGPGKVIFQDDKTRITLTDFHISAPNVFKLDRVDRYHNRKSGGLDFVGQVTFEVTAPPEISAGGVVNAASYAPKVAPGSLISIFGTDLAKQTTGATSLPFPTELGGTSVKIGGRPAPIVAVSAGQLNVQVPYETLEDNAVPVVVTVEGVVSNTSTVNVVPAAPGIFQFGEKRAVVQNENYSVNTAENPATVGSYVIVYLTGMGRPDQVVATGNSATAEPLCRSRYSVQATVNGAAADVVFSGLTPGAVGLMQVNMRIPTLAPGTYPLVITVNGVASNQAMITVQ